MQIYAYAQNKANFLILFKINIHQSWYILTNRNQKFEEGETYAELNIKKAENREVAWMKYLKFLLESRSALITLNTPKLKTGDTKNISHLEISKEDDQSGDSVLDQIEALYKKKSKSVLRRSLQSIPKNRHINFLTRYAVLEYKNQGIEAGRTNFENLVSGFAARTDVWRVYVDMETKFCGHDLENVRSLMDRVLDLPGLRLKTAKHFFKKYLEFEKKFGTGKRVELVKDMARDYVESRMENEGNWGN